MRTIDNPFVCILHIIVNSHLTNDRITGKIFNRA